MTGTALRFAYLHGFASSPLATKGVQLQRWLAKELNVPLDVPDLNIPSFRRQSLSRIVDFVEERVVQSKSCWLLIGSSFGGLVSTLVAQRQPTLVHSLVLLAPAFNPVERWSTKINIAQWKDQGFINHFHPATQRDEPVDYEFFQDLHRHPAYPLVTTCPLTIIHGSQDEIIPIETSREYMRILQPQTSHPTSMIEVHDDHHLRKKKTITTIKQVIQDQLKQTASRDPPEQL